MRVAWVLLWCDARFFFVRKIGKSENQKWSRLESWYHAYQPRERNRIIEFGIHTDSLALGESPGYLTRKCGVFWWACYHRPFSILKGEGIHIHTDQIVDEKTWRALHFILPLGLTVESSHSWIDRQMRNIFARIAWNFTCPNTRNTEKD